MELSGKRPRQLPGLFSISIAGYMGFFERVSFIDAATDQLLSC
jgi:hypothetical protein